ncbi:hypothetical protein [Paenibacillus sp. GCM10023250]|uniref:hypothetical protein n=1 Tax=Paenibacillus sp. GCM10023250 TaxID=3252648 RepID=UPI003610D994
MYDNMPGQPVNSQQLTYEQFQEQARLRQEQEQQRAKEALRSVGLDPKSQHAQAVVQALYGVESELKLAENQLQMQMEAQKRQIQQIQQKIRQAMAQVQGTVPGSQQSGANTQTMAQNYMQ